MSYEGMCDFLKIYEPPFSSALNVPTRILILIFKLNNHNFRTNFSFCTYLWLFSFHQLNSLFINNSIYCSNFGSIPNSYHIWDHWSTSSTHQITIESTTVPFLKPLTFSVNTVLEIIHFRTLSFQVAT